MSKTYDTTAKMSFTLFIVVSLFVIAWSPFFTVRAVLHFCKHYCFSWRIFFLTKLLHFGNSAVNPLVYGLRIPEYRALFLKFLGIKYAPTRDSIELDSRAVRNSPGNLGIFSNVSVNINFKNKQTPPRRQVNFVRCSSLPVITISAVSDVISGSKSQDMISTSTPS